MYHEWQRAAGRGGTGVLHAGGRGQEGRVKEVHPVKYSLDAALFSVCCVYSCAAVVCAVGMFNSA